MIDEVGSKCGLRQVNSAKGRIDSINRFSKISKRRATEIREEGEASDGEKSSLPSRNSNSGQSRADRTAKSVEKGIQIGRQESSEIIQALQKTIVEQQAEITGLKADQTK